MSRLMRQRAIGCLTLSLGLCSCSQYVDPAVPEPIQPQIAPDTGREYLLYRPSAYRREQAWPLVIVCPSSSPNRTMREWTELAEEHGFLVAVPELKASEKPLPLLSSQDQRPKNNRDNETQVLSVVQHVRAGHNISEDRIFIHGAGKAAIFALRAGLKHPDTFRAVSLLQPEFDRAMVTDVGSFIDPYQPVYLSYKSRDVMTGKEGRECADWLRAYGADLRLDPWGKGEPRGAVSFFQDVLRTNKWIQVRAQPRASGNPLEVRFSVRIDTPPAQYRWQFGDGQESPVAEPVHAYAKPGTYRVRVTVSGPKLGEHTRHADVTVPGGNVQQAHTRP